MDCSWNRGESQYHCPAPNVVKNLILHSILWVLRQGCDRRWPFCGPEANTTWTSSSSHAYLPDIKSTHDLDVGTQNISVQERNRAWMCIKKKPGHVLTSPVIWDTDSKRNSAAVTSGNPHSVKKYTCWMLEQEQGGQALVERSVAFHYWNCCISAQPSTMWHTIHSS